ncbi:hypothetical protein SAMN04488008_109101 [Maribacter orientalis]|uniref:Uncharacterized protein n=1 Tax=Maribacter orientalis TaxID=228957 RepID=A0A1H7VQ17_9FLAO|nr:DUF4878 domain-containing protein [Maribacter orientalis]SEM10979.1 hypothetical protein SAMN04488008_109101 [Maribacter orientalis]
MKLNYILIFALFTITISCGESKKEIEQKKAEIENAKNAIAEAKEKERIHLEKIEVGKSKLKINLDNEIDRLNQKLTAAKEKYNEINKFQFGRLNSTKQNQLIEQSRVVNKITSYIRKLEKEVSLINLRETFDFQNSPLTVVEYLFEVAQTKDFKKMRYLCDPYGENDQDVRAFCLMEMAPEDVQDEFTTQFKNGRIMSPIIENDRAVIEIAFGPSSNKLEKLNLIKRMDKWYLSSL